MLDILRRFSLDSSGDPLKIRFYLPYPHLPSTSSSSTLPPPLFPPLPLCFPLHSLFLSVSIPNPSLVLNFTSRLPSCSLFLRLFIPLTPLPTSLSSPMLISYHPVSPTSSFHYP